MVTERFNEEKSGKICFHGNFSRAQISNISSNYQICILVSLILFVAPKQKGIPLADTLKQLRKKKSKSKGRTLNNFRVRNAINQAIISENNQAPFVNNKRNMFSDLHKQPLQAVLEYLKLVSE